MISQRPTRLEKQPIVDALFEVRLAQGALPLSSAIPGLLFSKFSDQPVSVERLPAADVPAQIVAVNPQFLYQPVVNINVGQFRVSVGDRVLTIGCKLPYPGWAAFQTMILAVWEHLISLGFMPSVERHSMKYIDLIEPDVAKSPFGT